MNLLSFTSKAVGFVGRLPKMRKTVFGFDLVSKRFSKGWRREKWNGLTFWLRKKKSYFQNRGRRPTRERAGDPGRWRYTGNARSGCLRLSSHWP